MYALLRRVLLFSSFTLFSNFEYGFFDITVLVDDEDLGECNGSTTAGLGKREDRHTDEERCCFDVVFYTSELACIFRTLTVY